MNDISELRDHLKRFAGADPEATRAELEKLIAEQEEELLRLKCMLACLPVKKERPAGVPSAVPENQFARADRRRREVALRMNDLGRGMSAKEISEQLGMRVSGVYHLLKTPRFCSPSPGVFDLSPAGHDYVKGLQCETA